MSQPLQMTGDFSQENMPVAKQRTRPILSQRMLETHMIGDIQPSEFVKKRELEIKRTPAANVIIAIKGDITFQDIIAMMEVQLLYTMPGKTSEFMCTPKKIVLEIEELKDDFRTYSEKNIQSIIARVYQELHLYFFELSSYKNKKYKNLYIKTVTKKYKDEASVPDIQIDNPTKLHAPDVYVLPTFESSLGDDSTITNEM